MSLLQIENITKSFGGRQVLRGINFTMEAGEVLAIIGSSGSGKTTLLRCLNFLEKPDTGKITVNGELVYSADCAYTENEIREKRLSFGLVFQSFNLFPQYTVLKNLTLAPELMRPAGEREQIKDEAMALLKTVGLEDRSGAYPCELSGGQQQRVAIARALAMKPSILCFDEPTSALDPELTVEVLKAIRALKNEGRTMIVVTHEMDFAKSVADKVIFMSDGVIEEMGTPEQVFDDPQSPKTLAFIQKPNV